MKKIILLPKTDTVILCLPEDWAGVPIICNLEPIDTSFMNDNELEIQKLENYRSRKRKTKNI